MTPDIWRQIQTNFGGHAVEAEAEINALSAKTKDLVEDRLLRCIVFLSHGQLLMLRDVIELARTDYRDVIWKAECDCTEEQKRDFREPFKMRGKPTAFGDGIMTQNEPRQTAEALPTMNDFNPWGPGAFDAEGAWENFGRLTLSEAHSKFRERPDIYQEDFMFMGGKAFAFYFPVVESYLRDVADGKNEDDDQAWILAQCIKNQFDGRTAPQVLHLADRVIALSHYVRNNIGRFGYDDAERTQIAEAWRELEEDVQSAKQGKANQ